HRGRRRGPAARFPGAARPGEDHPDVWQLDLPGPALPRAAHAAPRGLLPLPQPGRQHAEGAGQALEAGDRQGTGQAGQARGARRHPGVDRRAEVLPRALPQGLGLDDLPRVHQVFRIDGTLEARHQVDRVAKLFLQRAHLAEADAVLAGARPLHRERAIHDALIELPRLFQIGFAVRPHQDLAVEVAVADVAEERDRHRRTSYVLRGLDNALGEARDRNADVGRHGARTGAQLQAGEVRLVARGPEAVALLGLGRPLEVHSAVLPRD